MRSDSSSEMPGKVVTLMVNEPSLKGGKKFRPKVQSQPSASTRLTAERPTTKRLCLTTTASNPT